LTFGDDTRAQPESPLMPATRRRGFENTGNDDHAKDQRQGRQGMKQAQRLRLLLDRRVHNR
jgi:hypothetical protein